MSALAFEQVDSGELLLDFVWFQDFVQAVVSGLSCFLSGLRRRWFFGFFVRKRNVVQEGVEVGRVLLRNVGSFVRSH